MILVIFYGSAMFILIFLLVLLYQHLLFSLDQSWNFLLSQIIDLVTPASKKSNREPSSLDKLLAKKRAERSAALEKSKKIANAYKVRVVQNVKLV